MDQPPQLISSLECWIGFNQIQYKLEKELGIDFNNIEINANGECVCYYTTPDGKYKLIYDPSKLNNGMFIPYQIYKIG